MIRDTFLDYSRPPFPCDIWWHGGPLPHRVSRIIWMTPNEQNELKAILFENKSSSAFTYSLFITYK
jgi:hypothetical protein